MHSRRDRQQYDFANQYNAQKSVNSSWEYLTYGTLRPLENLLFHVAGRASCRGRWNQVSVLDWRPDRPGAMRSVHCVARMWFGFWRRSIKPPIPSTEHTTRFIAWGFARCDCSRRQNNILETGTIDEVITCRYAMLVSSNSRSAPIDAIAPRHRWWLVLQLILEISSWHHLHHLNSVRGL